MKKLGKLMLASAAFVALSTGAAHAETVTTTTVVTPQAVPNMIQTDFAAFDLNGDNVLSMKEVGTKLFYIFDTDGNEIIDNIEINNRQVMTIIPMEKKTFTFVDLNNDGHAEASSYTSEAFIKDSRLARFDKNNDGLSAGEFVEKSFLELDTDNSKAVELDEWKKAYIASLSAPNADPDHYN
jgi:hypothetical protein